MGYAALIAQMYEWRNDLQWVSYRADTDRWDRAPPAFGEAVSDGSLTAMTAAVAQAFADKGWTRWVKVAKALREIESAAAVSLSAAPNPVGEGSAVTVTATLAGPGIRHQDEGRVGRVEQVPVFVDEPGFVEVVVVDCC